jgi:CheY-like chemotaxis protein
MALARGNLKREKHMTAKRTLTVYIGAPRRDTARIDLANALRQEGWNLVETDDGAELLHMLMRARDHSSPAPDVIVMDALMTTCSALGVLALLRRARWKIPAVVTMGACHASIGDYLVRLGAARVLRTPFDGDELRQAVLEAHTANVSSLETQGKSHVN